MTPDVIGGRSRSVGVGGGRETGHQEAIRETCTKVPPIKPVDKFLKVELTAGTAPPVIGSIDKRLRITDEDVDPMKHHGGLGIIAEGNFMIRVMGFGCGRVTCPAIGAPHPQRLDATVQNLRNGLIRDVRDGFEKGMLGVPFGIQTDPNNDGVLVGAPAPFARAMTNAPKIRIIEFEQPAQFIQAIAIGHGLLDFMMQQPRCHVFQSQFATQGEGRLTSFVNRDHEDRHKPDPQGYFGAVKEGPGGDGCLMMALSTFIEGCGPFGPLDRPVFLALTLRAQKSLRPPLLKEIFSTGFVGGKLILPFQDRHHDTPRYDIT